MTSSSKWNNREALVAYAFLLPSLIGFITFYAVPSVRGLLISFTDWDLLTEPQNVGLANYERLLTDLDFRNSLKVTFQYVLWNIPLQTLLAILIAVMMDRVAKSTLVRGILLLPWLMPNVIVALLFGCSTMIGYSYYGRKCFAYLAGAKNARLYDIFYLGTIYLGAIWSVSTVINLIDISFAMMAWPNMIATLLLAPKVMEAARRYFRDQKLLEEKAD